MSGKSSGSGRDWECLDWANALAAGQCVRAPMELMPATRASKFYSIQIRPDFIRFIAQMKAEGHSLSRIEHTPTRDMRVWHYFFAGAKNLCADCMLSLPGAVFDELMQ